jgi:hypothetical protein
VTRRGLSILVGITGTLVAGVMILLILVMGSVFSDARTPNIAGPGVDVFIRTPFPLEGTTVRLDVEARGGNRAAVNGVIVYERAHVNQAIKTEVGRGVTWGYTIQDSRSRGSDTLPVTFEVPKQVHAGDTMSLELFVEYVVAMGENGRFSNLEKQATIKLDLDVYSSGSRIRAQIARVCLALGCFLIWFLIVWGVAKLYAKATTDAVGRHNSELEGIGLLMGFIGGSIVGYWLFAWRIMNALELSSKLWAALFMFVWCVAPLWFVWKWWKRQKAAQLPTARVVTR